MGLRKCRLFGLPRSAPSKQRGAKSFKGVLGEFDKIKEKADKLRDDLQFAETEVTKAARAIEAIEGDPKTLTGDQTKTLESSTLTHKKNQKDLARKNIEIFSSNF